LKKLGPSCTAAAALHLATACIRSAGRSLASNSGFWRCRCARSRSPAWRSACTRPRRGRCASALTPDKASGSVACLRIRQAALSCALELVWPVQWLGRVPDTRTSVSVQDDTQAADNYPVNYAAQAVRAHTACQEPRECQSCTLSVSLQRLIAGTWPKFKCVISTQPQYTSSADARHAGKRSQPERSTACAQAGGLMHARAQPRGASFAAQASPSSGSTDASMSEGLNGVTDFGSADDPSQVCHCLLSCFSVRSTAFLTCLPDFASVCCSQAQSGPSVVSIRVSGLAL